VKQPSTKSAGSGSKSSQENNGKERERKKSKSSAAVAMLKKKSEKTGKESGLRVEEETIDPKDSKLDESNRGNSNITTQSAQSASPSSSSTPPASSTSLESKPILESVDHSEKSEKELKKVEEKISSSILKEQEVKGTLSGSKSSQKLPPLSSQSTQGK